MNIKEIINTLKDCLEKNRTFNYRYKSNDSFIKFLANNGVTVGSNVLFDAPETSKIDLWCPSLVSIGNNVFIGARVTLLPGTSIGDNCIIGACSLIKGNIPSGEVWAGNPAKYICTIDEYCNKRIIEQIGEAKCIAKTYYKKHHCAPSIEMFYPLHYQYLFLDYEKFNSEFYKDFANIDNDALFLFLKNYKRPYRTYDDFIKDCDLNNEQTN